MTPLLDHKNEEIDRIAQNSVRDILDILRLRESDDNNVKIVNSIQDVLDELRSRLKREGII